MRHIMIMFALWIAASGALFAQDIFIADSIKWNEKQRLQWDNYSTDYISFKGASYDDAFGQLPFYTHIIELEAGQQPASVSLLSYNQTTKLQSPEIEGLEFLRKELIYSVSRINKEKNQWAIHFVPMIITSEGGLAIFESFELQLETKQQKQNFTTRNWQSSSVLSSGNWYKVAVSQSGIHRISATELQQMGMAGDINPQNLRVYGGKGGMLPEANSDFFYDDLVELPIVVEGEDDGSFNAGDYLLFYAEGPHSWTYKPDQERFQHNYNVYDSYNYYFITADLGPGARIITHEQVPGTVTHNTSEFVDYAFHETEQINLINTGRTWLGESFIYTKTQEFDFNFPNLLESKPVDVKVEAVARSSASSYFEVEVNTQPAFNISIAPVSSSPNADYARMGSARGEFDIGSGNVNVRITYHSTVAGSSSWLNYIEVNAYRQLNLSGKQMIFRNPDVTGEGNITRFNISGGDNNMRVWNVTNPSSIFEYVLGESGPNKSFVAATNTLQEFVAFSPTEFYGVSFIEKVENQNLHGLTGINMVIVSHPNFVQQAQVIADYHINHDGIETVVVTNQQVYNEFSYGRQDVGAIRNFMRRLYESEDSDLKYLMLFGDASFDYKSYLQDNSNYVITWESPESYSPVRSYATDDFFGFLDEDEGANANGVLDIGIGRIPVQTVTEANSYVNKFLHYNSNADDVKRDWRNVVSFVADDEDSNLHINQAEDLAYTMNNLSEIINIDKIYFDAYQQLSTPGGQRYPDVTEAINSRMQKGALVINYTGHGGEVGWAHERVLGLSDISSWDNMDNMPVFITATCEFSRYDDPERTSAGEYVFLNPNGGAIAMFTTARATYAGSNYVLNDNFFREAFKKTNGEYPRLGDIMRLSKHNASGSSSTNVKKYILLGDPAMRMAYPHDSVTTTSINGHNVEVVPDTMQALAKIFVSGEIVDLDGNKLDDFNGTIFPTVYDKATQYTTFGQDVESYPKTFYLRSNILYKGKAKVENGEFEYSFVVPKDIAYSYGLGKISYYARSENNDASGCFGNIIVGGYNTSAVVDIEGPEIELYMNDRFFRNGGITDPNPILLADLQDETGINTVGNGIGHDIVAILDGNNENSFILNDYYEAAMDSYQQGSIYFPFSNLSEGKHSIELKVWDVFNNSSSATIEFYVRAKDEVVIENLVNYPNPMQNQTWFTFEHNQGEGNLDVRIQIFNMNGQLMTTIEETVASTGYRLEPIKWDGTTDSGRRLGKGFYIYRVITRTEQGQVNEKSNKLVIY